MWNEARSSESAVLPDIVQRAAGKVWQESPLVGVADLLKAHHAGKSKAFHLSERPFCDLVNLRGDAADPAFVEAVERACGCLLPVRPNTTARGETCDLLWLGPDEWLVRSREPQPAGFEAALAATLTGQFASAVDVGSGYTVLDLSGAKVRDVLARGCPLDLHPRLLAPGQCAQSHYFKASIVLVPVSGDAYEVIVRRSFADYFVRIMLDAAAPLLA
jgi:sarcosine oxidase, subunit gamma